MKDSTKIKLAIIAGMAIFGALILGIESATGYLAWYVHRRASYSPLFYGCCGLAGGALCALRYSLAKSKGKFFTIALAIPSALALGTICWALQAYGVATMMASLSPLGAALVGALIFGSLGTIGSLLTKD